MKHDSNITVGINTAGYPEKRNIIDPRPRHVRIKQVKDLMKGIDYLYFKARNKNHRFFHNVFKDFGTGRVDLYHFFNVISLGKTPWIVTFENELPRHNHQSAYLVKKLAGASCKKIIALSHNAASIERHFLKPFPRYADKILAKMEVMQPAQQLNLQNMNEKKTHGSSIHFAFVGGAFFHKGGLETLNAFVRLVKEFPSARLHIVSSFAINNWFDSEFGETDIKSVKKTIADNEAFITHTPSMNNQQVIDLFLQSDVALLPSFGETYGYAVLEAQSCGCPVITTNAWAFPEFNPKEAGWLLNLPLTEVNGGLRSDIGTAEKKRAFSKQMEEQLYQVMKNICESPQQVRTKAEASLQNIRNNHNIEHYRNKLADIYHSALNPAL